MDNDTHARIGWIISESIEILKNFSFSTTCSNFFCVFKCQNYMITRLKERWKGDSSKMIFKAFNFCYRPLMYDKLTFFLKRKSKNMEQYLIDENKYTTLSKWILLSLKDLWLLDKNLLTMLNVSLCKYLLS